MEFYSNQVTRAWWSTLNSPDLPPACDLQDSPPIEAGLPLSLAKLRQVGAISQILGFSRSYIEVFFEPTVLKRAPSQKSVLDFW